MSFPNCFKNYFWLPTKCIFKIPLSPVVLEVSSLAKEFLFQRRTVSKPLKSFPVSKEKQF
jgi:hypothetical protein